MRYKLPPCEDGPYFRFLFRFVSFDTQFRDASKDFSPYTLVLYRSVTCCHETCELFSTCTATWRQEHRPAIQHDSRVLKLADLEGSRIPFTRLRIRH